MTPEDPPALSTAERLRLAKIAVDTLPGKITSFKAAIEELEDAVKSPPTNGWAQLIKNVGSIHGTLTTNYTEAELHLVAVARSKPSNEEAAEVKRLAQTFLEYHSEITELRAKYFELEGRIYAILFMQENPNGTKN